jgi:5-methylcytosine-specific restriction endonuclease McrA
MPSKTHPFWDSWYNLERWRRTSRRQLQAAPLCAYCEQQGLAVPATVADHVQPHNGEHFAFWFGQLQSLCKPCHDGRKRYVETRGYSNEVGVDGLPIDKQHPYYRGKL